MRNQNGDPTAVIIISRDLTDRKRAEEAILAHQKHLEAIKDIGLMATTTMDLKTLLLRILDGALKAMGVSVGMIFLKNSAGDLFWGVSIGLSDAFVAEYEHQLIKPGEGLTGRIAETGETIFIEKDSSRDLRISRRIVEEENLNSFVGVPIYAEDDIIGVMNILSRPPVALHEQAVLLAGAIGVHVRSAIKNVRLYEQLRDAKAALQESDCHHRSLIAQNALSFSR